MSSFLGYIWSQLGQDILGEAVNDWSGFSVSLSSDGTVLAIGAPFNDGTSGSDRGHVRVYKFQDNSWNQMGSDIDGKAPSDNNGWSLSLNDDGTVLAIGAPNNDGLNSSSRGHVRVYQFQNNSWIQMGFDIDGEAANDQSGWSVSLNASGTIVAIGAPYNNGTSGSDRGHVRVYEFQNGFWTKIGQDIDGEESNDYSGYSVSLSSDGTIVAIGAFSNNGTSMSTTDYRGHTRVYKFENNVWIQLGSDIDGESSGDNSGYSVSLSANGLTVAIGAPWNDGTSGSDRGHVRVYKFQNSSWVQVGADIDGELSNDQSSISLSLNDDGTMVAISSIRNGLNKVDVYNLINNNWIPLGNTLYGGNTINWTNTSVSLSGNGQTVAIGGPLNDDGGNDRGNVRVYRYLLPPNIINFESNLFIKDNLGNGIQYSFDNINFNIVTNENFPLTLNYTGINQGLIYLTTNIVFLNNTNYFIIGTNNVTIDGSYNGTTQTIIIDNVTNYPGLFKNTNKSNITIKNIIMDSSTSSLEHQAGWFCQLSYGDTGTNNILENLVSNGNITNEGGGIIGSYACARGVLTISKCFSTGNITSGGGILSNGAGRLSLTEDGLGNITLNNCYSTGNIGNDSGGICGKNNSGRITINKCYSIGNMVGLRSAGIANSVDYNGIININYCYTTGQIQGTKSGGIAVCPSSNKEFLNYQINIRNCFTLGNISGEESGGISGTGFGALTNNSCSIKNCYSIGNITGLNSGGIVGANFGYTNKNQWLPNVLIENCYTTGTVNTSNGCGSICGKIGTLTYSTENITLNVKNCYAVNNPFINNNSIILPSFTNNSVGNGTWSNTTATISLLGIGGPIWQPRNVEINRPYLFSINEYMYNYSLDDLRISSYSLSELNTTIVNEMINTFTPAEMKLTYPLVILKTYYILTALKTAFTLIELKQNFVLSELKTQFTLSELKEAYTLSQLKLEFTLLELKQVYTVSQLKSQFTLTELKNVFTLSELKEAYTLSELKQQFTLSELIQVFTLSDLKQGYSLSELKQEFTLSELTQVFTLSELKQGYLLSELKQEFTLSELSQVFTLTELITVYSSSELRQLYTLNELKDIFSVSELKQLYTITELKELFTLSQLIVVYSLSDIVNSYTLEYLNEQYTLSELKSIYTISELKLFYSLSELKEIYTLTQLKQGYTLTEIKQLYTLSELSLAYSVSELKNNFPFSELKKFFTFSELKTAFTKEEFIQEGYSNFYYFIEQEVPLSTICFVSETSVFTDQGTIYIDKIIPGKHTINNKKIVEVTKTRTTQDKLVLIKKHCFSENIPNKDTIMTTNHKICINNKWIKAKELVNNFDNVEFIKYDGEILYNILMETHNIMIVNNLVVETLDPKNSIAILVNLPEIQKNKLIKELNNIVLNGNTSQYLQFHINLYKK